LKLELDYGVRPDTSRLTILNGRLVPPASDELNGGVVESAVMARFDYLDIRHNAQFGDRDFEPDGALCTVRRRRGWIFQTSLEDYNRFFPVGRARDESRTPAVTRPPS
jgi:hypothetical protein